MNETSLVLSLLVQRFPKAVLSTHSFRGDDTAIVRRDAILDVLRFLKETPDLSFEILMDLTAVDYLKYPPGDAPGIPTQDTAGLKPCVTGEAVAQTFRSAPNPSPPRFNVVYHLYSLTHNHRIRLKVPVEESESRLPSATALWPIANWLEREVWDMFGIEFVGHPDLRRLLMYDGFEGHPLRKDYPLRKRQPLVPAREGWEWAADQNLSFPRTERFDALAPSMRERQRGYVDNVRTTKPDPD